MRGIEKYCPDATFLNYTNPMAMLCRAIQGTSKVRTSGLCHSVQHTSEMLARWIGADIKDITYTCLYDPLTSSMLSMAEIKEMVNKMFETQKHWLPYFKAYKV